MTTAGRGPTFAHRYAVLVGIDDYTGDYAELPGCAAQAKAMAHLLQKDGYVDPKIFISSKEIQSAEPTPTKVFDCIAKLNKRNSFVFFYFAGHGQYERREGQELVCKTEKNKGTIALSALKEELKDSSYLMIIDACRTPESSSGHSSMNKADSKLFEVKQADCKVIFYATTDGSPAYMDTTSRKSIFTTAVLRVLRGEGIDRKQINWSTLRDTVSKFMEEKNYQSPSIEGTTSDFVIIKDHKTVRRSALDLGSLSYNEIKPLVEVLIAGNNSDNTDVAEIRRLLTDPDELSIQLLQKHLIDLIGADPELKKRFEVTYKAFLSRRL